MAHILIIGASSGIGRETLAAALDAGHRVRAFSRSANAIGLEHQALEKFRGDAMKEADVNRALDGIDVVVQALGVSFGELFKPVKLFSASTQILIAAMQRHNVRRLIGVTGFGAGDSREAIGCLQLVPFELVFGRAYEDKDLQERLIKTSGLDWTIVRPGILTNGPLTGRYHVLLEPSKWRNGVISRADVADFITRSIEGARYLREAPVLVS